jgi:hypothetical protein
MGDAALLSYFSLLSYSWPKLAGVLEHYREGETKLLVLHFSGSFLLTAFLRRRRTATCISLFIVLPAGMDSWWTMPGSQNI